MLIVLFGKNREILILNSKFKLLVYLNICQPCCTDSLSPMVVYDVPLDTLSNWSFNYLDLLTSYLYDANCIEILPHFH